MDITEVFITLKILKNKHCIPEISGAAL